MVQASCKVGCLRLLKVEQFSPLECHDGKECTSKTEDESLLERRLGAPQ